jgi:hypothetical protein
MCLPLCYTSVYLALISMTRNCGTLRTTSLGQSATTSSTIRLLSLHVKVRLAISIILTFLTSSEAGFIAGDPLTFVLDLSEKLAEFAPQLTLDFIYKVSAAMSSVGSAAISRRISCLQYMRPWIHNLSHFANATHPLYERTGSITRLHTHIVRPISRIS